MSSSTGDRSKKGKLKTLPSNWSEWEFDQHYNSWKRYRLDAKGEYEIEYNPLLPDPPLIDSNRASVSPDNDTQSHSNYEDPVAGLAESSISTSMQTTLGGEAISKSKNHIFATNPETQKEEFDPHYRVHEASEFKFGRIFKILWAEPRGSSTDDGADPGGPFTEKEGYSRERLLMKVRRFVILNPQDGHSVCLPISTYAGKGVTKSGVNAKHHTIVYSGKKPIYIHGEKARGLTRSPIKVNMNTSGRHRLDDRSRLNYAKQYTVEYNVKVWFIGKVDETSRWQLSTDYNEVKFSLTEPRVLPPTGKIVEDTEDSREEMTIVSDRLSSLLQTTEETYSTYDKPIPGLRTPSESSEANPSSLSASQLHLERLDRAYEEAYEDLDGAATTSERNRYIPGSSDPIALLYGVKDNAPNRLPPFGLKDEGGEDAGIIVEIPGDPLMPNAAQCDLLTDDQCRMIQDILDPDGTRAYKNFGVPHQYQLVRLYMKGLSFSEIETAMRGTLDCSYKTFHNRFRSWLFPTMDAERQQKIVELYSRVAEDKSLPSAALLAEAPLRKLEPVVGELQIHSRYSRCSSASSENSDYSAMASSVFSASEMSLYSKASSLGSTHFGGSLRLVSFLMGNRTLQNLFRQMFVKIGQVEFEKKLRICLLKFSKHIRQEAVSEGSFNMIQASRTVQYLSSSAARSVTEKLALEPPDLNNQPSQDLVQRMSIKRLGLIDSDEGGAATTSEESGGSEDEDEAQDHRGFVEYDILPTLEDDLLASSAYQLLIENLALALKSDSVRKSLFEIWPILHGRSVALHIDYGIEWEVQTFLQNNFPLGTKLGRLMTLSGSNTTAQAQSCEEYLAEKWPHIGMLLLSVVEGSLQDSAAVSNANNLAQIKVVRDSGARTSSSTKSRLKVSVTAVHSVHVQVLTALSWLCSAIRSSEHAGVAYSSSSIRLPKKKSETPSLTLRLRELSPSANEDSCWHSLFPHGVIAEGYPISSRCAGKGLEISFANMALASRCFSFVEYDKGLVAHGLTSMLIPMTELVKDNALQWHFESKTKQQGHKVAKVSHIFQIHSIINWHRELVPDKLVNRRCFLGWADRAVVTMGTKDYQTDFRWSGASKTPAISEIKSYSFTFGTSGMGYITAEGTRTTIRTAMQTVIIQRIQSEIQDLVRQGDENYVLVFDTTAKVGYYLPQACVVLHVLHSFTKIRNYEFFERDKVLDANIDTHFAKTGPDGASEAQRALETCFGLKIAKGNSAQGPIEEYAAELIGRIWHSLDDVGMQLRSAQSQFELGGDVAPHYVYGVEWKDAANMKPAKTIKRFKVDQPWSHLTVEHPIVLFSQDIPPPIVSASTNLCEGWATIPSNQNLLAATGRAVDYFLQMQNNGLAVDLDWNEGQDLIASHLARPGKAIQHVQKLCSTKKPSCNKSLRASIATHLDGCFVFGDGTDRKCSMAAHGSSQAPPDITTDDAVDEQLAKSLHSVPSECSDTSVSQGDNSSQSSNDYSLESSTTFKLSSLTPGPPRTGQGTLTPLSIPASSGLASSSETGSTDCSAPRILAHTQRKEPGIENIGNKNRLWRTGGNGGKEGSKPAVVGSPGPSQPFSIRSIKSFIKRPQSDPSCKGKGKQIDHDP